VFFWIPAFAGMTSFAVTNVIKEERIDGKENYAKKEKRAAKEKGPNQKESATKKAPAKETSGNKIYWSGD
jgi:hypothetical protein